MLILAPPSEGKATRRRGRALELDGLSFPELTPTRRRVVDALVEASARPDALEVLGVPGGAADQVAANTRLWSAPTLTAGDLYTGVLYDALSWSTLDAGARRRGGRRLVVQSALFGAVRPTDRIPPYRLSMDVDLPGIGKLAAAWRPVLDPVMTEAAGKGVVVDLRSATYAAAWRPWGALAERTVAVHVVRDGPGGPTAVSHMAKHTRGLVARTLLGSSDDPRSPEQLAELLAGTFDVTLDEPRAGRPRRLDVVEPS